MTSVLVRAATPDDLPAVLGLCWAMHSNSPVYRDIPFEADEMLETLEVCLDKGLLLVAQARTQLVGFALALVCPYFFSTAKMVVDLAIYVEPWARSCRAGMLLVRELIKASRASGADSLRCGITAGMDNARVAKLYRRLGFQELGTTFVLALRG